MRGCGGIKRDRIDDWMNCLVDYLVLCIELDGLVVYVMEQLVEEVFPVQIDSV